LLKKNVQRVWSTTQQNFFQNDQSGNDVTLHPVKKYLAIQLASDRKNLIESDLRTLKVIAWPTLGEDHHQLACC
jgi:hypothetical protein